MMKKNKMNNMETDHSFLGEILIVEDDISSLKYMSGLLTDANYKVRAAHDGELALRSIHSKLPDLILLDINMPGINGVEVCNRLKSDLVTADIPIIFISAEDKTDLKVKAFKAGCIDYVTKPVDPVEVLTRINTHLKMSQLQRQLVIQSERLREEIKERKESEKIIKRFSKIFQESLNEIYLFDIDTLKFTMVNRAAQKNLGYTLLEFQELTPFDLKPEFTDKKFIKLIDPLRKGEKKKIVFETMHKRKDQSVYFVEVHLQLIKYERKPQFCAIIIDITDRKQGEEQIKASLREKEVLLNEIHHRVKNNMQVIVSLLRLQSEKSEDKEFIEMLKESENRILSMALVHEQLYQSSEFSSIDPGDYIKNLVNELFVSHGVDTNKIKLSIECADILFDIENAIPCGLIINELVSNCLKYAFPNREKGKINITIFSAGEDGFELIVSDDGIGIPKNIDARNTDSMGLHLVKVLAEDSLEGTMEIEINHGTSFHFKLKSAQYKPMV